MRNFTQLQSCNIQCQYGAATQSPETECIVIGFFQKADFAFSAVAKLALWRPCYPPDKMVQQT